jgi:putative SOS response-associated peptidase YedK
MPTPSHASTPQPMAFAGLWEGFKWPDGTVARAFTIVTTYANEMVGDFRDRMPVILESEGWSAWLGEIAGDHAAETGV